ncbi:MAG: hypothetical protein NVSMB57_09510 [Actinomycetota bacterium]
MLVVLAAVWAAVLLPSLLRSRVASSPIDGVRSFEQAMGILGGHRTPRQSQNGTGRWVMVPREVTAPTHRRSRVLERRRRLFVRLMAFSTLTLAIGFIPPLRWVWYLNITSDALLGLYIWRLLEWKRTGDVSHAEPSMQESARLQVIPGELEEISLAAYSAASSKAVFSPSSPPVPRAQPAEVAADRDAARLSTQTG